MGYWVIIFVLPWYIDMTFSFSLRVSLSWVGLHGNPKCIYNLGLYHIYIYIHTHVFFFAGSKWRFGLTARL